jgi:general secretion pathway protein D
MFLFCNIVFGQTPSEVNAPGNESGGDFTLNLKNTDIHSLIATVSKQTGRNFVVDPRVKAKVTVISTDPVDADGLYNVFLSVLQVHGYSAVPAGDLIKIVPDVTAKQGPVPLLGDSVGTNDQLVTQVVPVVNVPAAQLVPILRPLVPQQGHLAAYAATNSLIITDRAANIERLMNIIKKIDRPDNEEIEIVRLEHASAAEIV